MSGLRNTEIKNFRGVDFWDNIPYSVSSPLTIPAKKTKIYAYLETLLGKSKTQKKTDKRRKPWTTRIPSIGIWVLSIWSY